MAVVGELRGSFMNELRKSLEQTIRHTKISIRLVAIATGSVEFERQILAAGPDPKLDYNKIRIMKLPNKLSCFENDDSFIPTSSLASALPWIFSITRLYQHESTRKLNFGLRPSGNFRAKYYSSCKFLYQSRAFYYEIIVTCAGMVFYRISLLDWERFKSKKKQIMAWCTIKMRFGVEFSFEQSFSAENYHEMFRLKLVWLRLVCYIATCLKDDIIVTMQMKNSKKKWRKHQNMSYWYAVVKI